MLLAYVRGVVADGKRGLGGNALALGGVVLGGHGQLLQAYQHLAVGAADDVAVHDIHVVYRLTGSDRWRVQLKLCSSHQHAVQNKLHCTFCGHGGMAPLSRPVRLCTGF